MSHISGKAGSVYLSSYLIEDCEDAWDEQSVTYVTASLDTTDYKVGSGSAKFAVTGDFGTGVIGSEVVSLDLTSCNGITAWVKSSVALDASDWSILTDETDDMVSPQTFNVPALTAGTWTFITVDKTMSGTDYDVVIRVGLNQNVDKGAMNFWIDDLRGYKAEAGIKSWTVDYTADTLETTDFGSAGVKEYIIAGSSWSGTFEGYKDGAPLTIGRQYGIKLYESATSTQIWTGFVLITGAHPSVAIDGVVSYVYDYQGTGALVPATT